MNPTEAVVLLSECRDLAEKLVSNGPNVYLEKADLEALRGFKAVKDAGWAENYDVLRLAGLTTGQVKALGQAMQKYEVSLGRGKI